MTSPEAHEFTELRETARQWFVSLLADPTAARWAEFEKWVNADPAHLEAYQAIEATWYAMENPGKRLADKEADELSVYLDAMDRAKRDRKTGKRLGTLGIVVAALVAGAIWLERPGLIQDLRADYMTARGERRTVMLADGSSVLLDADSALVDVSAAGERRVRLLRGGAFFEVVPSTIPFVVEAAGGRVEVLGTGFDVRLVADGGSVTLAHGRVSVRTDAHAGTTTLEPGQQVNFGPQGVAAAQFVELGDALAWRGGRYTFYRARLADVIQEIARYRRGRIVIVTSTLADERVTGSFPLDDTDAALASLQASVGFGLHHLTSRFTVVSP
ncbi:FecR family protein [Agrobacterium sp. Ap1]|uniref:FecR family protein n=1 Tax=Agrobacterium sp. Ap1 TaxID=2815337 RepID=UPI001A8FDA5A|nr:FecR family protein [Agrobacterium sp. Ap1]MBO0144704.1 FecR family protein [Agrobacterium sp. Ap1]